MAQPVNSLEMMKLNLRIQQILLSKVTMEVRIAEIEDEKERIQQNFPIYQKEIDEINATITALTKPKV